MFRWEANYIIKIHRVNDPFYLIIRIRIIIIIIMIMIMIIKIIVIIIKKNIGISDNSRFFSECIHMTLNNFIFWKK